MSDYWMMLVLGGLATLGIGTVLSGTTERTRAASLFVLALLAGLIGSRLLYSGLHSGVPLLGRQGQMLDGALVCTFVAVIVFAARFGLRPLASLDALAPGLGIGIAVARMGCLITGCCYGLPSDVPWALVPPGHGSTVQTLPLLGQVEVPAAAVHPTQAYEMIAALAGAGLAFFLIRRRARAGAAFFSFVLWLELFRLANGMLRQSDSTSAIAPGVVTAVLVVISGAGLVWLARPMRKSDAELAFRSVHSHV